MKTRWNSTYYMLQRAYDLKEVIAKYLQSDIDLKRKYELSPVQWLAVMEIIALLKPMATATAFLSKSKYPTLGSTLPIYSRLLDVGYEI